MEDLSTQEKLEITEGVLSLYKAITNTIMDYVPQDSIEAVNRDIEKIITGHGGLVEAQKFEIIKKN